MYTNLKRRGRRRRTVGRFRLGCLDAHIRTCQEIHRRNLFRSLVNMVRHQEFVRLIIVPTFFSPDIHSAVKQFLEKEFCDLEREGGVRRRMYVSMFYLDKELPYY